MKYHPDAKGAKNMGDDWTLPFQARQNSVKFNHQIHHQMDFGIGTI